MSLRTRYATLTITALLLGACGDTTPPDLEVTTRDTTVAPPAHEEPAYDDHRLDKSFVTTTTTAPPPPPTTTTTHQHPTTTTTVKRSDVAATSEGAPTPAATGGGYNDPNNPAAWDRLAECEAWGDWTTNTGNGYYGGLQFALGSWRSVGGEGYPHEASRGTQIAMGQRLYHSGGGWGHWPACSRKLGY